MAAFALTADDRIDGPWLAIPGHLSACAPSIVLAGDPRSPEMWRSIDRDGPVTMGWLRAGRLIPLSDFGVACSLYPHTRVLSVRVVGSPLWRGQRVWAGARVERLRIASTLWPLVEAGARDCNLNTHQRSGR